MQIKTMRQEARGRGEGGREGDRGHMMRFSGVKVCHPPVGRRISGRDIENRESVPSAHSATEEPIIYTSSAMSADCSYINTGGVMFTQY